MAKPRRHLGEVFKKLAAQMESRIEEGRLMPDHVHIIVFRRGVSMPLGVGFTG